MWLSAVVFLWAFEPAVEVQNADMLSDYSMTKHKIKDHAAPCAPREWWVVPSMKNLSTSLSSTRSEVNKRN